MKSGALNYTMQYKHATVFAPTNEAFQKLDRPAVDDETLISYHMSKYKICIFFLVKTKFIIISLHFTKCMRPERAE